MNLLALHVADVFICAAVIVFGVVSGWRGVWGLLDVYLLPHKPDISAIMSLVLGILLIVVLSLLQDVHDKLFPFKTIRWHIYSRIFICLQWFTSVNQWRGVWNTLDYFIGTANTPAMISVAISLAFLLLVRASKNLANQPIFISSDHDREIFKCNTYFSVDGSNPDRQLSYIADVFFTQVILETLKICHWRGTWTIIENLLYPGNSCKSMIVSLSVGYCLIVSLYFLQYPCAVLSAKLRQRSKLLHIVLEECFFYVATFACLNIWRGIWTAFDIFLYPGDRGKSSLVTYLLAPVCLFPLLAASNLGGTGHHADADECDGSGVYFEHYFKSLHDVETFRNDKTPEDVNDN